MVTNAQHRRTLMNLGIIRVRFFIDYLDDFVKVDTNLAVLVVQDYQHFVVTNVDAVQEDFNQALFLFRVVKVGRCEFAYPKPDMILA